MSLNIIPYLQLLALSINYVGLRNNTSACWSVSCLLPAYFHDSVVTLSQCANSCRTVSIII